MNIATRLARLEGAAGAGVCPACGEGGTGPRSVVLLPLTFDAKGRQDAGTHPDPCPACGRRALVLAPITFDGEKRAVVEGP